MQVYIEGMQKCLVQINEGGRLAISAALKLQVIFLQAKGRQQSTIQTVAGVQWQKSSSGLHHILSVQNTLKCPSNLDIISISTLKKELLQSSSLSRNPFSIWCTCCTARQQCSRFLHGLGIHNKCSASYTTSPSTNQGGTI